MRFLFGIVYLFMPTILINKETQNEKIRIERVHPQAG